MPHKHHEKNTENDLIEKEPIEDIDQEIRDQGEKLARELLAKEKERLGRELTFEEKRDLLKRVLGKIFDAITGENN